MKLTIDEKELCKIVSAHVGCNILNISDIENGHKESLLNIRNEDYIESVVFDVDEKHKNTAINNTIINKGTKQ